MIDLLKRDVAPVGTAAWAEIDDEARDVLSVQLGARRLVDFDGPHGWTLASVNLGTWTELDETPDPDVHLGLRDSKSLVEARIPITLSTAELDTVGRGARAPNLGPVAEAAEKLARFENSVVFDGSEAIGIEGIRSASPHERLSLPAEPSEYPAVIVEAMETLRQAGVSGPYGLALGPDAYNLVARATDDGFPLQRHLADIVTGPIAWVPGLDGAVLMSTRGGDFVLTVGQDTSIGYAFHTRDEVELFLTQSFTFRVLEPSAAVSLS